MASVLLCGLLAAAPAQAQVAWPTKGWETSTPEQQGMDSAALKALVEFGAANYMDSLLVARNGKLVLETYYAPFGPGTRHTINSATKAVLGGVVGIAIAQGKIRGTDATLAELLPAASDTRDARAKAITLQQLLDMTSGLDWVEPLGEGVPVTLLQWRRAPEWLKFVLDRPVVQPPGSAFNYNSGNSALVSAIVSQATGAPAEQLAAEQLFKPLGITDWWWRRDPGGISGGGSGLFMHPRDMAKVGLLYLRHGEWEGRQLIPRAWVDKVFRASVPMRFDGPTDFRYADGWWTIPARKAYIAAGFHRQLIVVLPESGIVAALNGRFHYRIEDLLDRLTAAVKSNQPLPPQAEAQAALAASVQDAAIEKPAAVRPAPPIAATVYGRTWRLAPNDLGIKEFTIRTGERPVYEIVQYTSRSSSATQTLTYGVGLEGRFVRTERPTGNVFSRGGWVDDNTLRVDARLLEEGETQVYVLRFDGDKVALQYRHTNGFEVKLEGEALK